MSLDTMGPIHITIDLAGLANLKNILQKRVNSALYRATKIIQQRALEIVPFRTGELYDSMKIGFSASEVSIGFDAPYARTVEMGAAPHKIEAKGDGMLSFWWAKGPDGPKQYFFRSVNHPGYSGRGFLNKIKQMALEVIKHEIMVEIASEGLKY